MAQESVEEQVKQLQNYFGRMAKLVKELQSKIEVLEGKNPESVQKEIIENKKKY